MAYVLGPNNSYVRQKVPNKAELKAKADEFKETNCKLRGEIKALKNQHERDIAEINRLHQIEIAKKDAVIAKWQAKKAATVQTTIKTQNKLDVLRNISKKKTKLINELKAQIKTPPKTTKELHLEIVYRTIIAYNKLTKDGILVFEEFSLLLVGSQKEFFSAKDVRARFGYLRFVDRDILRMIDAGYIAKVYRKRLYYLTMNGKLRINDILEYIYKEKGTGHPIKR